MELTGNGYGFINWLILRTEYLAHSIRGGKFFTCHLQPEKAIISRDAVSEPDESPVQPTRINSAFSHPIHFELLFLLAPALPPFRAGHGF